MKVILTEKVPFLGNVGEIVNVSPGHGRNYLIPKKLAVLADDANKSMLENEKKRLAKKVEAERNAANEIKNKIDGMSVELVKKVGGNGKLFGTVTNSELAKELSKQGVEVERRLITLDTPIKNLGSYSIGVKLFTDIEAKFEVKVVIDPKQAEELKAKQKAAEKRALARKEKEAMAQAEAAENADEATEIENEEQTEEEIKDFEKEN